MNVHLFQDWQSRAVHTRPLSAHAGAPVRRRLNGLGKWWSALMAAVRGGLVLHGEGESLSAASLWRNGQCRVPPRVWRRHSGYLVYCVGAARRRRSQ